MLALVLLAAPAAGAIRVLPPSGMVPVNAPLQLMLQGVWPTRCTPEVRAVEQSGDDVTLVLASPAAACLPGRQQFSTRVRASEGRPIQPTRAGTMRVRVMVAERDGSQSLHGFAVIRVGDPPDIEPENGMWWSERSGGDASRGPGIAVQLELQGETLGATILGYGDDQSPEWLFGAAPLAGNLAELDLLRLSGGHGPFGGYRPPTEAAIAGTLWVELHGAARATLWWVTPEPDGRIELESMPIVRFKFGEDATHPWAGRWYIAQSRRSSTEPGLLLRYVQTTPLDHGFQLVAASGHVLACSSDPLRPDSPPSRCTLADATGQPVAVFDDVALQRMEGVDPEGRAVRAIKLGR